MTKIDMVEQAMKVLGEVRPEELVAFVLTKHGEAIEPRFMPFFLASIRDRMRLESARRERAAAPKIDAASRP
jgi:hypothetical protein